MCNRTDTSAGPNGTWQGADAENGVVIVNEVSPEAANAVLDMLAGGYDASGLQAALDYLSNNGFGDQYTTKKPFVDSKLSPAGRMLDQYTGIVKRDERDISYIWRDENGVIRVVVGDNGAKHIEEDILLRTYVMADGSPIDPDAIPQIAAAA